MVEAKIRTFAKDCDLSPNMIDRSSYIVKLLETVSSGLPKEKHEKLTQYMCGMISNSIKNSSVTNQVYVGHAEMRIVHDMICASSSCAYV